MSSIKRNLNEAHNIYLTLTNHTRPLISKKRGNSVSTSVDLLGSWIILRRYWNFSLILTFTVSTSDVCFIRETASLHCSSVRITSVLDEASLSAVGPPLKDWGEYIWLSDGALFLWMFSKWSTLVHFEDQNNVLLKNKNVFSNTKLTN